MSKSDGGEGPSLKLEMRERVAIVTINRPQARNAINTEIRLELPRLFTELGEKGEARVIVLRGAGSQAFVSGADLRELQTMTVRKRPITTSSSNTR